MTTLTVKKANWIDDENVEVQVDNGNQFDLYGYSFELEYITPNQIKVWGDQWDMPVVEIYRFDSVWEAYCSFTGLSREHEDPIAAVVRVLCNIL